MALLRKALALARSQAGSFIFAASISDSSQSAEQEQIPRSYVQHIAHSQEDHIGKRKAPMHVTEKTIVRRFRIPRALAIIG
jgi:hypothetical protein